MPRVQEKIPEGLRPYNFHGVSLDWNDSKDQAVGDCPFCGREGKFSVRIDTGVWRCFVCGEGSDNGKAIKGGNAHVFIRKLHELSFELTTPAEYSDFAKQRKLLDPLTLISWGVCKSILTGDWLVPGYGVDGKLNQLYRYIRQSDGKYKLLPTPTLGHQLFYQSFDPKKEIVHIQEGPWDGMALWEVMSQTKQVGDGYTSTGNQAQSLLANANIIAAPGCETFLEPWFGLLAGKRVIFGYDSDHPRELQGRLVPPAGYNGLSRIAILASQQPKPPESIEYVKWGEAGYDPSKPSGYDVRDLLSCDLKGLGERITRLRELFGLITVFPVEEILEGKNGHSTNGKPRSTGKELTPLKCQDYKTLVNAWRKAMKWTDGLDRGLTCCLASIVSTKSIGDQLWIKLMSPASCLDGSTLVYDPVEDLSLTIKERYEAGKAFYIYSKEQTGELAIRKAEVPQVYPETEMFEVEFESGKVMRVTGGHRFWNGSSYVALHTIADELHPSSFYPLPSISELDLSTHRQDALRYWQTTQGCLRGCYACSCPCDEQPQSSLDVVQDDVPLQDDAQQRNHVCSYSDGQEIVDIHNRQQRKIDPPSSCNSSLQCADALGSEYREHTEQSEPSHCKSSSALQRGRLESQSHREQQPLAASLHPTTDDEFRLCVHEEIQTPKQFQYGIPLHNRVRRIHSCNESELAVVNDGVSMEALDDVQVSETQFQPLSKLSVLELDQHGGSSESPQMSFLDDTEQQFDLYVPVTQLASETPVEKRKADVLTLTEADAIVKITSIGKRVYYDFHVPETENYLVEGMIHHNTGKTSLAMGLAVAKKFVRATDTLRGFTSGYKLPDGSVSDLATELDGMTFIVMDGDTLLQLPNLPNILSEGRRLYDGELNSHFKNGAGKDVGGHRMTWIMCGTGSLRQLDTSELGARFLDCVIMDTIDDDLEDEILIRIANKSEANVSKQSNSGSADSQQDENETEARRLTGGYVTYLRENAGEILSSITMEDEEKRKCTRYGKFVAYMRARPSKVQDEVQEREMAGRLVSQITRLAKCLAAVTNKSTVDADIMRRTRQVTIDTARGQSLDIVEQLSKYSDGCEAKTLHILTGRDESKLRHHLRYLKHLGVVELSKAELKDGIVKKALWYLTPRLRKLYSDVME